MNNANGNVASFLQQITDRLMKKQGRLYHQFQITIADKVLEMRYWDEEQVSFVKSAFKGRVLAESNHSADAIFWCYEDNVNLYIPDQLRHSSVSNQTLADVYQGQDESGSIRVTRDSEMEAADFIHKQYYVCKHNKIVDNSIVHGHPLVRSLNLWAEQERMLILHSAAVGSDNKGVLISARGGAGKSTLSVTALLKGLNFVADDYVLMKEDGEPEALPLYTLVGLNKDMYSILNPELPVIKIDEQRNDKKFFDASSYTFTEKLSIKAIIFPKLTNSSEASIKLVNKGPVLVKLVHSSVSQLSSRRDTILVKRMLDRLKDLPAYEISLSSDLYHNVEILQQFIEEL